MTKATLILLSDTFSEVSRASAEISIEGPRADLVAPVEFPRLRGNITPRLVSAKFELGGLSCAAPLFPELVTAQVRIIAVQLKLEHEGRG
jgi:hypothetical protein